MIDLGEVAMLYFTYSDSLISVLVCHNIEEGEFVLQVPYYPSVQTLEEYNHDKCM